MRRAQQSGQDPQEFANHMFEHNHIPELVAEILPRQGAGPDRRGAPPSPTRSGNVVDLKNLRPDGTIGEPGGGRRGARESAGRPTRPIGTAPNA